MNIATKSSVSFSYGGSPSEEFDQAFKLFEPIADKILAITLGNHDERIERETGIDLMALLASKMGIEERYLKYSGIVTINLNVNSRGKNYSIFVSHGTGLGGGRTKGGKANAISKLAEIVGNCDIYLMGHVHQPLITSDKIFMVDKYHGRTNELVRHFVITSAFLNYGGYGQKFNYSPQNVMITVIDISNTIKVISNFTV